MCAFGGKRGRLLSLVTGEHKGILRHHPRRPQTRSSQTSQESPGRVAKRNAAPFPGPVFLWLQRSSRQHRHRLPGCTGQVERDPRVPPVAATLLQKVMVWTGLVKKGASVKFTPWSPLSKLKFHSSMATTSQAADQNGEAAPGVALGERGSS